MKLLCSLFFCLIGSAHAANTFLMPPWHLLKNQLSATLAADPCVQVDDLIGDGANMEIKVRVCNDIKAQALAAFINKRHEYNAQLAVTVQVYSPDLLPVDAVKPASLEDVATTLSKALRGNKYFIKMGMGYSPTTVFAAYASFKPAVVQYHSDDISDWYLNTNEVAAVAFSEVLNLEGIDRLFVTTAPVE